MRSAAVRLLAVMRRMRNLVPPAAAGGVKTRCQVLGPVGASPEVGPITNGAAGERIDPSLWVIGALLRCQRELTRVHATRVAAHDKRSCMEGVPYARERRIRGRITLLWKVPAIRNRRRDGRDGRDVGSTRRPLQVFLRVSASPRLRARTKDS